jgi:hypothetical protein
VVQRWETNTWPGITQAGEFDTEIRDTRRPRLFDDGSRFQNIKDRPMLFPTNPEWFHLGSYATPLVGDVRQLAPLVEWSSPPMGRLGADGERMPCDTTGHNLPVVTSAATQRLGKTFVVNTYEGAMRDSVPLWVNPPAVVQLQEAVNDEQRPHPEQGQERFQEYSRPDDRCEENPDRWSRRRGRTMTGSVQSGAQQSEGGTQREGSPRSSDEVDLQNVIDGLRHKRKFPTRDQPRTQGRYEPSSKGTDQNEHRTRRHKYETDPPPNGRRKWAPHGLIDDDQHHKQMLRWPSETQRDSPTFEGVWQDGRTSSRGSKKTGLPVFVSIAYDSEGLHP